MNSAPLINRLQPPIAVVVFLLIGACGCHQPIPTNPGLALTDSSSTNLPTEDAPSRDLAPPVRNPRQAAMARATAGLIFTENLVTVNRAQITPFDDAAAARDAVDHGYSLLERGYRIEAIAAFTQAVIAAPGTSAAYVGLARALAIKGRSLDARAAVRTALTLEPNDHEARFFLGLLDERLGDRTAAMETYEQVLEQAPLHGPAHVRLAVLEHLVGSSRAARQHLAAAQAAGAPVPARLAGLLAGAELGSVELPAVDIQPAGRGTVPTVGPQVRIDAGGGVAQANEISAAASVAAPGEVVTAWNDFRTEVGLGVGVTVDGGTTWTDLIVRPPVANQSVLEGDPMTAADPRTGILWVGGLSFLENGGIFVARKQPGTATFEPSVMVYDGGGVDKPWMAAGRPPATPNATHLYVTYNFGLQTSTDLGDSWGPLVVLEPGIGYLPRVGPLGELYVANTDYQAVRLQTSLDGGMTIGPPIVAATRMEPYDPFETVQIPGTFRAPSFNYLAVDPTSGRLTFVWFDTTAVSGNETDVDLYFSHSDDGVTWTLPAVLALPGDQFLPWLEIDAVGRMHLVFLDTRNTAQSDSDTVAWLDAYYAYSENGGASWSEIRLTSVPWSSALAGPFDQGFGEQFIGDYLALAVAGNQVLPVYLSTENGDADLFTRVITFSSPVIFADNFESGDTSAWD